MARDHDRRRVACCATAGALFQGEFALQVQYFDVDRNARLPDAYQTHPASLPDLGDEMRSSIKALIASLGGIETPPGMSLPLPPAASFQQAAAAAASRNV